MATLGTVNVGLKATNTGRTGTRTSEFWFMAFAWLVSLCISFGWIPAADEAHAREIAERLAALTDMAVIVIPMVWGAYRTWSKVSDNKTAAAMVGAANAASAPAREVQLLTSNGVVTAYLTSDGKVVAWDKIIVEPAPLAANRHFELHGPPADNKPAPASPAA